MPLARVGDSAEPVARRYARGCGRYRQSKLAQVLMARELPRRMPGAWGAR